MQKQSTDCLIMRNIKSKTFKMRKTVFSIILVLFGTTLFAQGYKINVNIKNIPNKEVILGHHFAGQLIPDDTIRLNSKGFGVFKNNEALPGGMYFLFLPNKSFFDFLIDKDQVFSISADTTDYDNTVSFNGCEENVRFQEYKKSLNNAGKKRKILLDDRKKLKDDKKKLAEIDAQLKKLGEEIETYFQKTITEYPNDFFAKFLKATRQVEVPKTITDRKQKYFWFRHHYFDNFDISDSRMLRTPIYENTVDTYLDKVLMQHPDTLIPEVDMLIEKSRSNDELFRYMLVHLFNKYASSQIMTSENVYMHIAEKYYIKEATWSDSEFISELKKKVKKRKKCLIGVTAQDIVFNEVPSDTTKIKELLSQLPKLKSDGLMIDKSGADSLVKYNLKVELLKQYYDKFPVTSSLNEQKAKYTILWFWTPDCSHCKKETPLFHDLYVEKKLKDKGVEILSIFLQKDITDWKRFSQVTQEWLEFIKKHQMTDWTNAWDPFDPFRINYDIHSSPVLYLLDENKKIIAKRIGYEQAIKMIEAEMKHAEGKK